MPVSVPLLLKRQGELANVQNEILDWSVVRCPLSAAFGSALTARELGFRGICVRPPVLSKLVHGDAVSGRTNAGASCPIVSLAREASTLSLATRHAGFSRRGVDPVGETLNVPDTPLGSRRRVVSPPAPDNRRHSWYSRTMGQKSQESPKTPPSQSPRTPPSPRSRGRGRLLSPYPPRQRGSASSTQTRPELMSIPTCTWFASPLTVTPSQFGSSAPILPIFTNWSRG